MRSDRPVLFVDDEKHIRLAASQALDLAGFHVECVDSVAGASPMLTASWPGVVVTDVKMPREDGLSLLQRARKIDPELPVILVTGHGDVSMAVHAMRSGAYDFLEKPFSSDHLVVTVTRAMEKRALVLENRALRVKLADSSGLDAAIIGSTPVMDELRRIIRIDAVSDADVLIHGETGTGKELVARSLHALSHRCEHPFVAVNCGAIPEAIMESELFGHERGAFTSASTKRVGKFEFADGGTFFLDEVESMPLKTQVKLLRVLQDRSVERLGSNESIPFDVRVIAAAKRDLREASAAGEFREDLYYRLNVLQIHLPPLRKRREDIPLLFQHFVSGFGEKYGNGSPSVTVDVIRELMSYDWPGNVRELQNTAERFVLGQVHPQKVMALVEGDSTVTKAPGLADQVEAFEKCVIANELERHKGNITATFESLSLPRKTLYDKMQRYKLDRHDYL